MHLQVKKAKTLWDKARGLLGYEAAFPLLFQTRFGIHTFGMKYPIDVVVLDNLFVVQKMQENLKPNRLFFWNPQYQYILELPEGSINKLKIKKGVLLTLDTRY